MRTNAIKHHVHRLATGYRQFRPILLQINRVHAIAQITQQIDLGNIGSWDQSKARRHHADAINHLEQQTVHTLTTMATRLTFGCKHNVVPARSDETPHAPFGTDRSHNGCHSSSNDYTKNGGEVGIGKAHKVMRQMSL